MPGNIRQVVYDRGDVIRIELREEFTRAGARGARSPHVECVENVANVSRVDLQKVQESILKRESFHIKERNQV